MIYGYPYHYALFPRTRYSHSWECSIFFELTFLPSKKETEKNLPQNFELKAAT